MIKTIYVSTKDVIKALRVRKRLLARGFVVMWTGNGLICFMK